MSGDYIDLGSESLEYDQAVLLARKIMNNHATLDVNMVAIGMQNLTDFQYPDVDNYYTNSQHAYSYIPKAIIWLVFGGILIIGVLGNGTVIVVVSCCRRIRSPTYVIIASLAVADFIFILVCVPIMAAIHLLYSLPLPGMCKIRQYGVYCSMTVSAYHLVLLAGIRYIILTRPMFSRSHVTLRSTIKMCVCLWLIVCLAFIPTAVFYVDHVESIGDPRVVTCWFTGQQVLFDTCISIVSFFLPFLLIATIHLLKFWSVNGSLTSIMTLKQMGRREKLSVITVVIIVLVFLLCWGPFHVVMFIKNYTQLLDEDYLTALIPVQCLAYGNSCINPLIYAFLAPSFRREIAKFLTCTRRSPTRSHSVMMTSSTQDALNHAVNIQMVSALNGNYKSTAV